MYGREYLRSKQFFFLLWYGFILYLNCILGDSYLGDSSGILALTHTCALFIVSVAPFVIKSNETKFFYVVFLLLLIFTSIATFYFNLSFPDVVRNDPTITGLTDYYEFSYLYRMGLTRYQFAHAIPILIPPFVMAIKDENNSYWKRIFCIMVVILCVLHTYSSGATTPFLLALAVSIVTYGFNPNAVNPSKRLLIIFGFLLLFLNESILAFLLDSLSDFIGVENAISRHIADLQSSLAYDQFSGDLEDRHSYYLISWLQFMKSPLWGVNEIPGHHSVFLDHLAAYGMIGFIPFIMLLWLEYKWLLKRLKPTLRVYYLICFLAAISLLATKNVNIWTITCFLFIAAPIFLQQLSKVKE